jgi:UDP-2,3-diacylglucosamine pyrophosphatase LpxH
MHNTEQLRIGLLNDLHYDGGVEALNRLYESVAALNQAEAELLVVLGDLTDGRSEGNTLRLLREVSALCESFSGTVRYMPGNHDLDHISKAQFYNALGAAGDDSRGCFRLNGMEYICIDGNYSPDGTEYDAGNFSWKESGIPEEQLEWLRQKLNAAKAPVILFTHQRIDTSGHYSVQNHAAVCEVIRLSGKVKAVFQGHQHADDLRQIAGTAYYTLGAHVDGAGPALVQVDSKGIRLTRDYRPAASVESS